MSVSEEKVKLKYQYAAPLETKVKEKETHRVKEIANEYVPNLQKQYKWAVMNPAQCSNICGRSFRRLSPVCIDRISKIVVPDSKCAKRRKPFPRKVVCNNTPCPAEWKLGKWSECSTTCGVGIQKRNLHCRQKISDNKFLTVDDERCGVQTFSTMKKCILSECEMSGINATQQSEILSNNSKYDKRNRQIQSDGRKKEAKDQIREIYYSWIPEHWESCSVSCGFGVKQRKVGSQRLNFFLIRLFLIRSTV